MKVLFLSRRDIFKRRGGDTIQIEKTSKMIADKYDVKCDVCQSAELNDIKKYDLVHIFGIIRIDEAFQYTRMTKEIGGKVVLSPIYWNLQEYNNKGRMGLTKYLYKIFDEDIVERFKGNIRNIMDGRVHMDNHSIHAKRRYVLETADMILPNSVIEIIKICEEFGLSKERIRHSVVPNAVDRSLLNAQIPESEVVKIRRSIFHTEEPYVICVARYDPRKNHINLIKAMDFIDVPLLLIGNRIDTQRSYFSKLVRMVGKNPRIRLMEYQSQEQLIPYYCAASVHALPSWAETPGLVNIEAAACGCRLVVSNRGSEMEYFGSDASYCDPDIVPSIVAAIRYELYERPTSNSLRTSIHNKYTWERAAEITYRAYRSILN